MLAVVQCASSDGGSPRIPTRITPPFFWASASEAPPATTSVTAAMAASSVRTGTWCLMPSPHLFLEPDVVESDPLRLLVEALELLGRRPEPEEVAVADHRRLLVEDLVHLLPEREALLVVRLADHLGLDPLDLLVARPAGPVAVHDVQAGGLVGGADPGGEGVVLLGVVASLHQGRPVHDLEVDGEAHVLELLLRHQGEVVHPLVLLGRQEAERLALVAGP